MFMGGRMPLRDETPTLALIPTTFPSDLPTKAFALFRPTDPLTGAVLPAYTQLDNILD